MKKQILILFAAFFIVGCASKGAMYSLDGYDNSLYQYDLNKDPKQVLATLDKIIAKNPKKTPPGVYAHYGYILASQNQNEKAKEYFDKEMALYPESRVFLQRVKEKLK